VRFAQAGAVQVFAVSSVSGPAEAERRQADHAPRPVVLTQSVAPPEESLASASRT